MHGDPLPMRAGNSSTQEHRTRRFTCLSVLGISLLIAMWSSSAQAEYYSLVIDPGASGFAADVAVELQTVGTLIGDYDPETNPTGTRTKPGLIGSFGPTENVAVPASIGAALDGNPSSDTVGGAELRIDWDAGTVQIANFHADFVDEQAITIPIVVTVGFDSFRTRSPDSLYIGAQFPLPLGDAVLSQLMVVQTGEAVSAPLTPIGPGLYSFTLVPTVELTAAVSFLGTDAPLPATPLPLPLIGTIAVEEGSVVVSSSSDFELDQALEPGVAIPQFPLDLPTILPPGGAAHLLLDLVLSSTSILFVGSSAIEGLGSPITPGDCNADTQVDLGDWGSWLGCLSGPGATAPGGCGCADGIEDGAADLRDFALLQVDFGS